MEPRDGVAYHTTYYRQTADQRRQLTKHFVEVITEITEYLDQNPHYLDWAQDYGLKGFPKSTGGKRSLWDIMTDIAQEARGRKRDGQLKDYAKAPIDRWNRLFEGTEYQVYLMQRTEKSFFQDLS
jgi:hypothetical protein